jgi:Mrp family chromosome partitioning ATPase
MALAEAAVRAGRGPAPGLPVGDRDGRVLVILMGPEKRRLEGSPTPSVRIVDAQSPAQVHTLLSEANEELGLAIVVAPAPQTGPDCISLASAADATVLVATSGRTRFGDAQLAASFLRQVGVKPSAALLLSKEALRQRSWRANAAKFSEDGQRVGYGDRPAPPEVAG